MTVTEATALLGVTRQAVLQAISRGKLAARRMGKAGYIITLADIDRAYRATGDGRFMLWPTAPGRAGLLLIDNFMDSIKKGGLRRNPINHKLDQGEV
jgi:excisionase family DNA binding protein